MTPSLLSTIFMPAPADETTLDSALVLGGALALAVAEGTVRAWVRDRPRRIRLRRVLAA